MENNRFKNPGDIEEETKSNASGTSYFSRAGDLEQSKPNNSMSSYFTVAGSLETPKENNSFTFEDSEKPLNTPTEIRNWLKTIVSGEKKSNYAFGEGLLATGAGQKFVTIDELKQMINNGDNIIKADYYENMNMVFIEFESFSVPSKSR